MAILIIKLGALGDVLRTTTILPALTTRYPGCRIEWVTSPAATELLSDNPFISRVIDVSTPDGSRNGTPYDLVVSLDEDPAACALAGVLRRRSRLVGAYRIGRRIEYTADAAVWFDMSRVSRHPRGVANRLKRLNERTYPEILHQMLGLPYRRDAPTLRIPPEARAFAARYAAIHGIRGSDVVFGVNAGAGSRWKDKKLGIAETAAVLEGLAGVPGARLLLLGGRTEQGRNDGIAARLPFPVLRTDGTQSVLEFAALIALCTVLVTSDSLALHLGVALRKPVVAFFYPTSAAEIELYGRGIKIIGRGDSYCSYERVCRHPPVWDLRAITDGAMRLAGA
jgi:heptosyltransferase-2